MRFGSMRLLGVTIVALAVVATACTSSGGHAAGTSSAQMSSAAGAYLDTALDLMQRHSLARSTIDWTVLRRTALHQADGAVTPADTYPAIRLALLRIGDPHSRLVSAASSQPSTQASAPVSRPAPTGELLDARFALLTLPATAMTNDVTPGIRYAQQAQDAIRTLDASNPCGWIVDLRTDFGGSSWAMLAGLAPLLSKGTVGYFVYPDRHREVWKISGDKASLDGHELVTVDRPYLLRHTVHPAVAILTGPQTASAAEATVVAFHGQPSTRTFGAPSYGVPTGTAGFPLSDGALLIVSGVQEADRSGHVFPEAPIAPDETTSSPSKNRPDQKPAADVAAAQKWLRGQVACTGTG